MTMEYKCKCGKVFSTISALGGHSRHCKTVLGEEKYNLYTQKEKEASLKGGKKASEIRTNRRIENLNKWISEKHTCEKCGKVMTEKFGSGRFCSRQCSNSRIRTDEIRIKTSETLRKRKLSDTEKDLLLNKPLHKKEKKSYNGPNLPRIEKEALEPGFFSRSRMSYAEKFWQQVLLNNEINFEHDFVVQKPLGGRGVYRLDFLIDNIDLEIDGSLHTQEATIKKDMTRDSYLECLGYRIYRIPWINPNTDTNKLLVNKQIEDLFKFLNKPRLV